jgi:hypothetical protein
MRPRGCFHNNELRVTSTLIWNFKVADLEARVQAEANGAEAIMRGELAAGGENEGGLSPKNLDIQLQKNVSINSNLSLCINDMGSSFESFRFETYV